MAEDLEISTTSATTTVPEPNIIYADDVDSSTCSTPYVSAPSSPGHGGPPLSGYYYSAPASPMHFVLSTMSSKTEPFSSSSTAITSAFEFDFSAPLATDGSASPGPMSSADELFLNGQIRPMKLSTHLQRPQMLAPLLDLDENDDPEMKNYCDENEIHVSITRGRDLNKLRDKSLRRRTRSMSPLRSSPFDWREEFEADEIVAQNEKIQNGDNDDDDDDDDDDKLEEEVKSSETTPYDSGNTSRSSSVGRSSRRWVFLKEFLYRSKSEGRNNGHKFWSGLSFSPVKDKKMEKLKVPRMKMEKLENLKIPKMKPSEKENSGDKNQGKKRVVNGVMGKRRVPPSAHELHYTANRAQAEEMRKKTFLPYRQGLLGCLGFSSKSYGAWNGFTRALNPVSSR